MVQAIQLVGINSKRTYVITADEANINQLLVSRTPDQGQVINLSTLTNITFQNGINIYYNGIFLQNDLLPVVSMESIESDVARSSSNLNILIFSGGLLEGTIIQIVDTRTFSGGGPRIEIARD